MIDLKTNQSNLLIHFFILPGWRKRERSMLTATREITREKQLTWITKIFISTNRFNSLAFFRVYIMTSIIKYDKIFFYCIWLLNTDFLSDNSSSRSIFNGMNDFSKKWSKFRASDDFDAAVSFFSRKLISYSRVNVRHNATMYILRDWLSQPSPVPPLHRHKTPRVWSRSAVRRDALRTLRTRFYAPKS